MELSEKLKEARKGKNMTLRELGKLAKISCGYLCEVENGKKIPSLMVSARLEQALKLATGELVLEASLCRGKISRQLIKKINSDNRLKTLLEESAADFTDQEFKVLVDFYSAIVRGRE